MCEADNLKPGCGANHIGALGDGDECCLLWTAVAASPDPHAAHCGLVLHWRAYYGAAVPNIPSTISGFVHGETTATSVTGAPSLSTTATAKPPTGSYPITVSAGNLAAANYTFTYKPGALTVTKAVLTVNASNLTKIYGAALPTLTTTMAGFINGDTGTATTGTPSLTTTGNAKSAVGSFPISLSAGTLAAANYSFAFKSGTLTVTKAVLTVNANHMVRPFPH